MNRDPERIALRAMVEKVRLATGGKLSPEIERAMKVTANIRAATVPTTDTAATKQKLVEEIATSGKVPADLAIRAAALRATADQEAAAAEILAAAGEEAEGHETSATRRAADDLLDRLRAALDEVLSEVREVGAPLAGKDLGDPVVQRLRALSDRYSLIRQAYAALCRTILGRADDDGSLGFSEYRNADALWGGSVVGRYSSSWRPWPTDPIERLIWSAGIGAYAGAIPEPWLPRPAEQDAVYSRFIESRSGPRVPTW